MKTIRQALAECTAEQLNDIAHLWSRNAFVKGDNRSTYQNELILQMQDMSAARLLLEQLTHDERTLLNEAVQPSSRNGISSDALMLAAQLPQDRFELAIERLRVTLLIQISSISSPTPKKGSKAAPQQKVQQETPSKEPAKAPSFVVSMFSESIPMLFAVCQEFYIAEKDRSQLELVKLLATISSTDLYHITRIYHFLPMTSFNIFADLAKEILIQDNPLDGVEGLAPETQSVLQWLYEQGGEANMQKVRDHTGYNNIQLLELLHTFTRLGLVFDTFSQQRNLLFIPKELYLEMKRNSIETAEVEKTDKVPVDILPTFVRPDEPLMLYDIATLVNATFQQNIEPTQQGKVPKRIATKLRPLLRGRIRPFQDGSDNYLDMLLSEMDKLEIIELSDPVLPEEKARYQPGSTFEQWSTLDTEQQTVLLMVHGWLVHRNLFDVVPVSAQDTVFHYRNLNDKPARDILLSCLSHLEVGKWYTLANLLDTIWDKYPFALRYQAPRANKARKQRGGKEHLQWIQGDGALYAGLIGTTLHDLGIVTLGYEPTGDESVALDQRITPNYLMLSALGAKVIEWIKQHVAATIGLTQLLGQPDDESNPMYTSFDDDDDDEYEYDEEEEFLQFHSRYKPAVRKKVSKSVHTLIYDLFPKKQPAEPLRMLVIQPSFELLLMQLDFPALYRLLPFVQVQQISMVSRFTLTRASVVRGCQNGLSDTAMIRTLEEHSQKGLPQNVLYTLQDWIKGYKSAVVTQVLLLDVSDENAFKILTESKAFHKFGLRPLGPTTVAVTQHMNIQELKRELQNAGIFMLVKGLLTEPEKKPARIMHGMFR